MLENQENSKENLRNIMSKKFLLILALSIIIIIVILSCIIYLNYKTPKIYHLNITITQNPALTLKPDIATKISTILNCARKYNIEYTNILSLIDYSLPSSDKRLWIFDLKTNKLLFNTYVAHGLHSGTLSTNFFSNNVNSKASSIGVFDSGKNYHGRDGLSLKLNGLEKNFNDNAYRRALVVHGAWYVNENFIKKYGRAGRSWGCPTIPLNLVDPILKTIKDNSLWVVYYPNNHWFSKSKFLNCNTVYQIPNAESTKEMPPPPENKMREAVLFAHLHNNHHGNENEPILTISADNYQKLFHMPVPLERMLRCQINDTEYIALTPLELKKLAPNKDKIQFVTATVRRHWGYFATEMNIVNLGNIKEIKLNLDPKTNEPMENPTIYFEDKPPITLTVTNKFIRWIGL